MAAKGTKALTRVERYLAHLDQLTGGIEPTFTSVESTHDGLPRLTVLTYEDIPERGMLTALTYGLSLADHADWRLGKPELCLSVASQDKSWALAMGFLAESLRGEAPFCYGNTFGFGEQIAPESAMDAFVVFAPAVLERDDFTGIEVGDRLPINIAGLYPIHAAERLYIGEHGLEAFWAVDWDVYDVGRPPALS